MGNKSSLFYIKETFKNGLTVTFESVVKATGALPMLTIASCLYTKLFFEACLKK